MSKTIEQRPNQEGMVKPGELIEIRNAHELNLADRRIVNKLIENAWGLIESPTDHCISVQELRGSHKGNERVSDSLSRLRTVELKVPTVREGKRAVREFSLLGSTERHIDESDPKAKIWYNFSPEAREILKDSKYWGRVKSFVCFAYSSKYAVSLYEALCLRVNRDQNFERFSDLEFRRLLGVEPGKYTTFPSFRQRVVEPSFLEVNKLSDIDAYWEVARKGGSPRGEITHWIISWSRKSAESWNVVMEELSRSKVGRKARISTNSSTSYQIGGAYISEIESQRALNQIELSHRESGDK